MISLNFTLLLKFLIKIFLFLYENEHSLSEYVYNHIIFSQQILMDNYCINKVCVYIYIYIKKSNAFNFFHQKEYTFIP